MSWCIRGESELLSALILVGLAIVLGISMTTYFISIVNVNRGNIDLISSLIYDSVNQVARVVTSSQHSVIVLLRRLDNSSKPFFIAIDNGSRYIDCSSIYVYSNDRTWAKAILQGSYNIGGVQVLYDQGVTGFVYVARARGYPIGSIPICRISIATRSGNIVLNMSGAYFYGSVLRIHIISFVDNVPYVVKTYEYLVRPG